MYEEYSRQSLPPRRYRELLGTAVCVFNSNNQFIIESILRIDNLKYNWSELIDLTSGDLSKPIKETITKQSNKKIATVFSDLVFQRNRIIHSVQITKNNEQVLSTKHKSLQYIISEEYLLNFIKQNERLSLMLHDFRGY